MAAAAESAAPASSYKAKVSAGSSLGDTSRRLWSTLKKNPEMKIPKQTREKNLNGGNQNLLQVNKYACFDCLVLVVRQRAIASFADMYLRLMGLLKIPLNHVRLSQENARNVLIYWESVDGSPS
ncbi:uncharacterized protein LOC123020395 isoform X4 [Varanus komodoensis]|uniref:uncharacterized protein LOC123020395 isoform X4 n=1 Tax=Varanus komodoensis TaxID=61221 RepID=UPI001CF76807|nr:uncharacterized protein LOC123020395 isoform X4 [Varanus komodoensis]